MYCAEILPSDFVKNSSVEVWLFASYIDITTLFSFSSEFLLLIIVFSFTDEHFCIEHFNFLSISSKASANFKI